MSASFSDPAASSTSRKPLVNLLRGWPHPSLLPTKLLQQATQEVFQNPEVSTPAMLYGPDAGFQGLRENLAKWLTSFYKPSATVPADRIAITGGASQSLGSILDVYSDPIYTRNVWCVAPTYMLAFRIFEDAGLKSKLRAVPEDDEGIDISFLQKEIAESERKAQEAGVTKPIFIPARSYGKVYKHVIYAVPTFSNPSFKTMSLRRREELVRLARKFDALIVTDDVYDFLQWRNNTEQTTSEPLDTAVLPRVVDIDRSLDGGAERSGADEFGNALSNGSFSKIAGPGLRTGWVEGTPKFVHGVSQAGTTRSGGAPSQLTAAFISSMLAAGSLQNHVSTVLQSAYAHRYGTMLSAIRRHLIPLGATLPQSDRDVVGGYFIWLTLPDSVESAKVVIRAREDENLIVAGGELFEVPGDTKNTSFKHDLRLCFAWESEEKLSEGIERLAAVVKDMLDAERNQKTTPQTGKVPHHDEEKSATGGIKSQQHLLDHYS